MLIYDAGSDWLTMTFGAGHPQYVKALTRMRETLVALSGGGKNCKKSNWMGYDGYQSYGLFVGERHDGFIIRASGHEAKLIEKIAREDNWDGKATRLDLQVTAQCGQAEIDLGSRVQQAVSGREKMDGRAQTHNVAVYKVAGADSGVTLGSRSSGRYCRFYDKTLEQRGKVAPNLWRYEVEFKGDQARLMYLMLKNAASGYWLAQSIVKTTFELHGVDMSWMLGCEQKELPSTYRQNDDERRLNWLSSHVRGVVQRLKKAGYTNEVLRALDLAEFIPHNEA